MTSSDCSTSGEIRVKICEQCFVKIYYGTGLTDPTTPEVVKDEAACEACRLKREAKEAIKSFDLNCKQDDQPAYDITTPPGVGDLRWLGCKEAGDVADSADNAECFDKIKAWIEDCSQNHTTSCGPSLLTSGSMEGPKRLIDTGPLDGDISLRLTDWPGSGAEPVEYCALSYSWGSDPAAHFTTTMATYEQRRNGFLMTQLPPTLRDAVIITRKVGCRFLWVHANPSVCISASDSLKANNKRAHRSTRSASSSVTSPTGKSNLLVCTTFTATRFWSLLPRRIPPHVMAYSRPAHPW